MISQYLNDGYIVIIDTCSILNSHFKEFITKIRSIFFLANKQIYIIKAVAEELMKFANNSCEDKDITEYMESQKRIKNKSITYESAKSKLIKLKKTARNAIKLINDNSEIFKAVNDVGNDQKFGDIDLLSIILNDGRFHKFLLITQDKKLQKDVIALHTESVKRKDKKVFYISKTGDLKEFDENNDKLDVTSVPHESLEDHELYVKSLPGIGEFAYTATGDKVKLESEISRGGEGVIYKTNLSKVAKIYFKNKITEQRLRKINFMVNKHYSYKGICFPKEILYNDTNEFVGFMMNSATGKTLQSTLFFPGSLKEKHPDWNKKDTVQIAVEILKKIVYLHKNNIIMGDINPNNILVDSIKNVYFVDTDSYQVDNCPCPVGTLSYTAPEIQEKDFKTFLRSFGNENFAVATLLFMIMLVGQKPYTMINEVDSCLGEDILKMDFPYPLGTLKSGKVPVGPWRFMWSHLPYKIKEMFYNTFIKDGAFSLENTRLSSKKWLSAFKWYLDILEDGSYCEKDEMSMDIFPTRFKREYKTQKWQK